MPEQTGTTRFFHLVGHADDANGRLTRASDYRAFLHGIRTALNAVPIRLISYTLVPGAWHLIVSATDESDALALGQRVASSHPSAIGCRPVEGVPGPSIRTSTVPLATGDALIAHCVTVERLALAAGLVTKAQDWPWCSVSERFRMQHQLPLTSTTILTSRAWLDHLNQRRQEDARSRDGAIGDVSQHPGRLTRRAQA